MGGPSKLGPSEKFILMQCEDLLFFSSAAARACLFFCNFGNALYSQNPELDFFFTSVQAGLFFFPSVKAGLFFSSKLRAGLFFSGFYLAPPPPIIYCTPSVLRRSASIALVHSEVKKNGAVVRIYYWNIYFWHLVLRLLLRDGLLRRPSCLLHARVHAHRGRHGSFFKKTVLLAPPPSTRATIRSYYCDGLLESARHRRCRHICRFGDTMHGAAI